MRPVSSRPAAALATQWGARLRIASFTVRPFTMFGGSIERSAEELVVAAVGPQGDGRGGQAARRRSAPRVSNRRRGRGRSATGTEWREAVEDIAWEPGDVLLLGSGAAGPMAQVFLGTAASKILRRAPRAGDDRAEARLAVTR